MEKNKFFTLWLAGICIIVFILQNFINGFTEFFVLDKNAINNLEVWRFVSAIFLHASLSHILFNLFALVVFGLILERLIGSWNFLVVFFFSGIIANLVSVNFYSSSLGASGAIMGIIGCLTVLNPLMMVWVFGLLMPLFIAAIIWIIGDVLGVFMPSEVGNIAHLSGVGVGLLIGLLLRYLGVKNRIKENKIMRFDEGVVRSWEDRYMR
jgi:membrane associated rhomboid family serine protease